MGEQAFQNALERIRDLVDEVLPRRAKPNSSTTKPKTRPKPSSGLPEHILSLRDSGFLKQPRTAIEVHGKLQSTYACEVNRVAMALLRMHKRRILRKTSKVLNGKRQIAYVS